MFCSDMQKRFFQAAHDLKMVKVQKLFSDTSQGEFFVMKCISRSMESNPQGLIVSDLAKMLKNAPPTTSRFLKNLEEKGWVVRRINNEDRRNIDVVLTDKGKQMLEHMEAVVDDFMKIIVDRMGDEKIEMLIELFGEITLIMEDELNKWEGSSI